MDVMIEDTIFRVIQESTTTAVRHGRAVSDEPSFFEDEEDSCRTTGLGLKPGLWLWITDDGTNFHPRRTASI